jgi:hypothetical protein
MERTYRYLHRSCGFTLTNDASNDAIGALNTAMTIHIRLNPELDIRMERWRDLTNITGPVVSPLQTDARNNALGVLKTTLTLCQKIQTCLHVMYKYIL